MKAIQRIIEIPLDEVRSEKYEQAIERLGDHSDTCFICGKRTAGKANTKMVQYLTNGNIVSTLEEIEGSQGCFPVGPECAKKLIIRFAF